jgi:negative regulator of flagellin synthesis FlgM
MTPINPINRSTTDALSSNASKSRDNTAADSPSDTRTLSDDTVSLSQDTLQVRELQQQLDSVSEIDADKVAAIKAEIANGNYPLDPDRIAENLLKLEKALTE